MKIVIAGTAYPYRGGLAAYNERLASQCVSEKHDVEIYTFSLQYPGFLFPGKTQYLDAPAPANLKIRRLINSVNPFNWIRTGFRLRRERPDLLIFKYWLPFMAPCFGTIARIAGSNRKTKIICIFDNVIPHEKRPGDKILTRYFVSAIDGAVAMSASVLDDLRLFRKDIPAKLNPHPLFDNFGAPISREEALTLLRLDPTYRYILFFGFIRAYKGLDLLIKAFGNNNFDYSKYRLIVAGEFYEDDKPYIELLNGAGITDHVVLVNRFINDSEVAGFFCAADLVVQPYRSATQSGVTQIAYHFSKPMIVTDVGGLREIVPDGKCGFVVKPDESEIASAIQKFYKLDLAGEFVENIKAEKSKYTWSKMVDSVNEVYNDILTDYNKK
jgi:glycosyltransferase involved in cell wall biosynthesis